MEFQPNSSDVAWILKAKKTQWKLGRRRIFGLQDLPEEKFLSRRHFEAFVKNDEVWITDLGSTNGTFLAGKKLTPNKPYHWTRDLSLRIGETDFQLLSVRSRYRESKFLQSSTATDLLIFIGLTAMIFGEPSMANGQSVGALGFSILLGLIALSTVLSALTWNFVFKPESWNLKKHAFYFFAVSLTALGLYSGLFIYMQNQWSLAEKLVAAKVEFFCLKDFRPMECIRQVNLCPNCAHHIEKWKRDIMAEKLKALRAQYPESIQAKIRAQEATPTREPSAHTPQSPSAPH